MFVQARQPPPSPPLMPPPLMPPPLMPNSFAVN